MPFDHGLQQSFAERRALVGLTDKLWTERTGMTIRPACPPESILSEIRETGYVLMINP